MSRFLAVVANSVVPGLAPASLIVRWSGRTSSPVVRSVGRTLYYISFLCRVFGERLSPSCFVRIALVTLEYLMAAVEALHTVVTKVSQEEGRLLMSIIALSSSSIVVPVTKFGSLSFRTR